MSDIAKLLGQAAIFSALEKTAAVLTEKGRAQIKKSNFALPGKRYPIHDAPHARNALARVSQYGTADEKAKVRAAVAKKYPGIFSEKRAEDERLVRGEDVSGIGGAALGGGLAQKYLPDVGTPHMTKFRRGGLVAAMIGGGGLAAKATHRGVSSFLSKKDD